MKKAISLKFEMDIPKIQSWLLGMMGIDVTSLNSSEHSALSDYIVNQIKACRKKWTAHNRTYSRLPANWLAEKLLVPVGKKRKRSIGRQARDFNELGQRARDKATVALREGNSASKLLHATKIALRKEGKHHLVFLLNEAVKTPERALKLWRLSEIAASMSSAPRSSLAPVIKLSPYQALGHLLLSNWTKQNYIDTRQISKRQGADIWPAYGLVLEEKKKCHPPNIQYEELKVKVSLVDRLMYNDQRLVEAFMQKFNVLLEKLPVGATLRLRPEGKWGFDGSTGHWVYNQAFDPANKEASASSLLASCYTPLL